MGARIGYRGLHSIARLGVGSVATVLVLSSCGGYGGGGNYTPPAGGVTCGSGAYSNPCPAPSVGIITPAATDTVSGMVTITASASASDGLTISNVSFMVDGSPVGSAVAAAPYTISWDSTAVTNGNHQITAVAKDDFSGSPNSATSAAVTVNVQNAAGGMAVMSPMQLFPAPQSAATGMARIEVQPESGAVHGSVSLKELHATTVTINEGFAGETGAVLLRLAPRAGSDSEWDVAANATLSAEQLDELRQGRLYVLAGSARHPAGEIRGQLLTASVAVRFAQLAPNEAARALGIKAAGIAAATVDTAARTLTVHVNSSGIDDAMAAEAAARALAKDTASLGHWSAERVSLRAADLQDFDAGRWNVSIAIPEETEAALAGTIPGRESTGREPSR